MTISDKQLASVGEKPMVEQSQPHFRVTDRDTATCEKVIECRAMSTPQIETCFYTPSSRSRCLLRVNFLYKAGFLGRIEQPTLLSEGRKPYIYYPRLKAVQLVAAAKGVEVEDVDWDGKEHLTAGYPFLAHILAITDVNVAFTKAAQRHGATIETWLNELILKRRQMIDKVDIEGPRGAKQKAAVVPDAYTVLKAGEHTYHLFLEVDRGTEVGQSSVWGRRDIARKIYAYRYYMTPPAQNTPSPYEQRYGTNKGRVLFVATSPKRMLTLKEVCEKCGGRARFWFSTLEQVTRLDPFTDAIWKKAGSDETFSLIW